MAPLIAVALAELGVIIWLWRSRRDARRRITELTLLTRRAELRAVPTNWITDLKEGSSDRTD